MTSENPGITGPIKIDEIPTSESIPTLGERIPILKKIGEEIRKRLESEHNIKELRDYAIVKESTPKDYISIKITKASPNPQPGVELDRNKKLYSEISTPLSTFFSRETSLEHDTTFCTFRFNVVNEINFRHNHSESELSIAVSPLNSPSEPIAGEGALEVKETIETPYDIDILTTMQNEVKELLEECGVKYDVDYTWKPANGKKLSYDIEPKDPQIEVEDWMFKDVKMRSYIAKKFSHVNNQDKPDSRYFKADVKRHPSKNSLMFNVAEEYNKRDAIKNPNKKKETLYNPEILIGIYKEIVELLKTEAGLVMPDDYTMEEPNGEIRNLKFVPTEKLLAEEGSAEELWSFFNERFVKTVKEPFFSALIEKSIHNPGTIVIRVGTEYKKRFDRLKKLKQNV